MNCGVLEISLLLLVLFAADSHGARGKEALEELVGFQKDDVFARNLVVMAPKTKDIIKYANTYFVENDRRLHNLTVLGYVTPWNNHGYDVAKIFGSKIGLVSPVWLQVKPEGHLKYGVTGTHDVDQVWLRDVRNAKPTPKIVPRLLFDSWAASDYRILFTNVEAQKELARTILSSVQKHKFDGIVVEIWSQVGGRQREALIATLKKIAQALHERDYLFILVVPPPVYADNVGGFFTEHDFLDLYEDVDYFSLMTYDYSSPARPGANSPINWMRQCVEILSPSSSHRSKILLGLNFYGNDYSATGGGPIIGRQYLEILKKFPKSKLKWNKDEGEHYFEYTRNGRHTVFYPSLFSVDLRVKLAEELGAGLSVWELGQGLDYFYDLL